MKQFVDIGCLTFWAKLSTSMAQTKCLVAYDTFRQIVVMKSIYKPLIQRGVLIDDYVLKTIFLDMRDASATNIDLWVDGRIYPQNPTTKISPSFRSLRELLEFDCARETELLQYTKLLASSSNGHGIGSELQTTDLRTSVQSILHKLSTARINEQAHWLYHNAFKVYPESTKN